MSQPIPAGWIDISALLIELGIDGDSRGREIFCPCPNQGAHEGGTDSNPSWRMVIDRMDPKYGQHFCHPCGFGGGPIRLLSFIRGLSTHEAKQALGLEGGATGDDALWMGWDTGRGGIGGSTLRSADELALPSGSIWIGHHTQLPPYALAYWYWKVGTDPTGLQGPASWGCAYGISGRLKDRIIIPARTGGRLMGYSARAVDFRGLIREKIPGRWPDESSSRSSRLDRLDFETERMEWKGAIKKRANRVRGHQSQLLKAALDWLAHQRDVGYWPGIRYLTPRESRGSKGQLPEPGARMSGSLMFWDLIFPLNGFTVTLVEGGIKAMRLASAHWPNPVGIPGASGLTRERRTLLSTASRILFPVDPDPAGWKLARQLETDVGGRLTSVEIIELGSPVDRIPITRLTELNPLLSP